VTTNGEPTEEQWRDLARQASQERDPEKLADLAEQIIEEYDEAKKKKQ
jgi:hypothetical protein